jgi:hypothetical protein
MLLTRRPLWLMILMLTIGAILLAGSTLMQFYSVEQQPIFSLGILHVDEKAASNLQQVLRTLTFSHPEIRVVVVDGTTKTLNSTNYVHPNLHFDMLDRRTGAAGCYSRFLSLANSRFVGVIKSDALGADGADMLSFEHSLDYIDQQERDQDKKVVIFVPQSASDTPTTLLKFNVSQQKTPNGVQ